jgi:hypothetical protein
LCFRIDVRGGESAEDNFNRNQEIQSKPGETTMFNKTRIALSIAIVFSAASGAFAGSDSTGPDCTRNGPFFYADTYGVPPAVQHQVQQPHRLSHKH